MSLGASELEAGAEPLGRAREPGGGRKRAWPIWIPGCEPALLALVEPDERGDPDVAVAVDDEVGARSWPPS